jgi:hypothetical protein
MRAFLSRTQPRHIYNPVSRASRPARSRNEAAASASRMQRRRVRAVSARLEAVQKVLTNSSQTAVSDCKAGVRCRYPGTGSPLPLLTTQGFVRIGVIPQSNRRARSGCSASPT